MADQSYDTHVTDHYAPTNLTDAFLHVLRSWDKEATTLTPNDLAPIDQFHFGGLEATLALARLAGVTAADRILDVGGGFGGPARTLAHTFGCNVTVLDLTAAYCQVGEMLTARSGLADRVTFQHGNALAAPFPDKTFDLIWTQHSSMNIADKRGLYMEIARLFRPGGRLALYEIMAGLEQPLHFPVPWARDASLSFLLPVDTARTLLGECGFHELAWDDLTTTIAAASVRTSTAVPPPGLHLVLGDDFLERGRNGMRNFAEGRTVLIRAVLTRP